MKRIFKFVIILTLAVLFALAAILFGLSKLRHQSLHQQTIDYLNKEFDGRVTFKDFGLSYLRSFPRVHVRLEDISVMDQGIEVITIDRIEALLNPFSLWKNELKLRKLVVTGADMVSVVDSTGSLASALKPKSRSGDSLHQALILDMRRVEIRDSRISFINEIKRNSSHLTIFDSHLNIRSNDSVITVTGNLEARLDSLISNNSTLFANQPVRAKDVRLTINRRSGVKELDKGTLIAHSLILTPRLKWYPFEDGNMIELSIAGEDHFDQVLGLVELHLGFDLKQVNPDASIKVSYHQSGFVNQSKRAYSEIDFEIKDARFTGSQLPLPVEVVLLSGNYNNGTEHSPATTELKIDTISARVEDSFLTGNFSLSSLHDPHITALISAGIDLDHVFTDNALLVLGGRIEAELSVNGKISELRKVHYEGRQHASGNIKIRDLTLRHQPSGIILELVNGSTSLNNHIIEIASLAGGLNESAFHFSGIMENLDQYLLNKNESFQGRFTLSFDTLDLNNFVIALHSPNEETRQVTLPYLSTDLTLDIQGKKIITGFGDFSNIAMKAHLLDNDLTIRSLETDYQDGHLSGTGNVTYSKSGITYVSANINGDFQRLDFSLPKSPKPRAPGQRQAIEVPDYLHAKVNLKVKNGSFEETLFSDLILDASLDGPAVRVKQLGIRAYDAVAQVSGGMVIGPSGLSGLELSGKLNFNTVDLETLKGLFGGGNKENNTGETSGLPEIKAIDLVITAKHIVYKDLTLNNFHTVFKADNDMLEITGLTSVLPFGSIRGDLGMRNYRTEKIGYAGSIDLVIDSLDVDDFLAMEAWQAGGDSGQERQGKNRSNEDVIPALPERFDFRLDVKARRIGYGKINLADLAVHLSANNQKISLDRLNLGFAGGKVESLGHINLSGKKDYPGYAYLKTDRIDLGQVLRMFDNFDQDKFTYKNTKGKFSSASHHYFKLNEDLTFHMADNLWLVNAILQDAELDRVEPIQRTLFFAGHKSKDTMLISELNANMVLVGPEFHFTDLVMNDNIANLELYGQVDVDNREMDVAAEISLTDLFFRSKKERKIETMEGIIDLENDSKLFLRLYGPLSDHKIDLVSKRKFGNYRKNLMDDITAAREEFREKSGLNESE
jgi:uncharacterized protein involved in outer membrane biogenesis